MLYRRSQEINCTLSKEELSKLLFKKMMIQPSQVATINTSNFGKIHLELNENVKPEKSMNLPVFDIRVGLQLMFTDHIIDRTYW